jgi:hypothetical protein
VERSTRLVAKHQVDRPTTGGRTGFQLELQVAVDLVERHDDELCGVGDPAKPLAGLALELVPASPQTQAGGRGQNPGSSMRSVPFPARLRAGRGVRRQVCDRAVEQAIEVLVLSVRDRFRRSSHLQADRRGARWQAGEREPDRLASADDCAREKLVLAPENSQLERAETDRGSGFEIQPQTGRLSGPVDLELGHPPCPA